MRAKRKECFTLYGAINYSGMRLLKESGYIKFVAIFRFPARVFFAKFAVEENFAFCVEEVDVNTLEQLNPTSPTGSKKSTHVEFLKHHECDSLTDCAKCSAKRDSPPAILCGIRDYDLRCYSCEDFFVGPLLRITVLETGDSQFVFY